MGGFAGKVAVVTGGRSLIGHAIAERFVAAGGEVVLGDLDLTGTDELHDQLGDRARFVPTDVTDDDQLARLLTTAATTFGGVDVVVSGAAVFAEDQIDTSRTRWLEMLDINVVGAARLISLAVPYLRARGGGAIVTIASVSGHRSQPGRVVYPATKAALLALTRNAAQQLAPDRIRVNAVSPGWTWSHNLERRYGSRERADRFGSEIHAIPRMADPVEVAEAVLFLASDASSFTTGADLAVDGGYLAMGPEGLGQAAAAVPPLPDPGPAAAPAPDPEETPS